MEGEIDSDQSVLIPRSEPKVMAGEKRSAAVFGEGSELQPKRVKMRDLESVFRSEDIGTPACVYQMTALGKHGSEQDANFAKPKAFGWDLNAEDVSTSLNQNPFAPCKNLEHLKSSDASECASSTGPLEEKDPMSVWKEMKQNGFLSCHGGIPIPKPRGRKSKVDGPKKKMEIAKREQVDRFAKIAAPSGLLNELNPGIINHVRNSKQVLSIIEALVRSEKQENRKQAIPPMKSGMKDLENANGLEMPLTGLSCEDGSCSTLSGSQQKIGFPTLLTGSVYSKDEILPLKLSSSATMTSGNISSLSNEESENIPSVSSLSVKAANVASQWLELLYQDTKGRLAALQRSKKRVRAVIYTELPLLMSKEFSSNKENDQYGNENSTGRCSNNANADSHRVRWSALFDQMDKSLCEEEKQLESWLNQVKDMKHHCEWGLQHLHCHALHGSQRHGTLENDSSRLEELDKSAGELAIRAAAASIYSTCNLAGNLSYF